MPFKDLGLSDNPTSFTANIERLIQEQAIPEFIGIFRCENGFGQNGVLL
jgi:hypothetical protein